MPPGLYAQRIASGRLATVKGYRLTAEDRLRAEIIERLMCDFRVDVAAIERLPAPNVVLVRTDVRDPGTSDIILERLGRPADVVLSDLAPKLTGVRATDEARSEELNETTLTLLPRLLAPAGRLVMKTFMSPGLEGTLRGARSLFAEVKTTRPGATRRGSSELYLVGIGFRS